MFASSKGHWGEDLLALMLIMNNGKTLNELSLLLSDGEHVFDELKEWKLCATQCLDQSKSPQSFLSDLCSGTLKFNIVLANIHKNAGPDLCLLLRHVSDPSKFAILVIQCKVEKYPPVDEVLKTLNPGNKV
jgi:hypothetical protein